MLEDPNPIGFLDTHPLPPYKSSDEEDTISSRNSFIFETQVEEEEEDLQLSKKNKKRDKSNPSDEEKEKAEKSKRKKDN